MSSIFIEPPCHREDSETLSAASLSLSFIFRLSSHKQSFLHSCPLPSHECLNLVSSKFISCCSDKRLIAMCHTSAVEQNFADRKAGHPLLTMTPSDEGLHHTSRLRGS